MPYTGMRRASYHPGPLPNSIVLAAVTVSGLCRLPCQNGEATTSAGVADAAVSMETLCALQHRSVGGHTPSWPLRLCPACVGYRAKMESLQCLPVS